MNYGYITRSVDNVQIAYVYSEDLDNPQSGKSFFIEAPSVQHAVQIVAGLNATQ